MITDYPQSRDPNNYVSRDQVVSQQKEIESLRQQLADSQKREVMLRTSLLSSANYIDALGGTSIESRRTLAATADLENVRLCEKEHAAIVFLDYDGNGAVLQTELADNEPLYRAWEPK